MSIPPLLGGGDFVIARTLHMQIAWDDQGTPDADPPVADATSVVRVPWTGLWRELLWLAPLILLKPLMTAISLAGGGSGGVFAPSLYLGAVTGAVFGLVVQALVPSLSAHPGVYAIVGMGAVVAGTHPGVRCRRS